MTPGSGATASTCPKPNGIGTRWDRPFKPTNTLTQEVRQRLNQTGHQQKRLFQVGDGSFCNRTVLAEDWEAQNVTLLVRCRKGQVADWVLELLASRKVALTSAAKVSRGLLN